jgi:two-component system phosphate regulon response regulator PhoB
MLIFPPRGRAPTCQAIGSSVNRDMVKHKKRILIVEDESAIRDMLRMALEGADFIADEADNVKQAQYKIADKRPDLIVLDWMLPGLSGAQLTKRLKHEPLTRNIPIIMLTAKAEEDSKVQALEAGADDYMTKPFSPRELIARIHSVLRRGPLAQPDGSITVEQLVLNTLTHQVSIAGQSLHLSPREYRLLAFFVSHPNRIYSRSELLTYVWNGHADVDERAVDSLLKRLRKQLKSYGYDCYIQTAHGAGYYFNTAEKGD